MSNVGFKINEKYFLLDYLNSANSFFGPIMTGKNNYNHLVTGIIMNS